MSFLLYLSSFLFFKGMAEIQLCSKWMNLFWSISLGLINKDDEEEEEEKNEKRHFNHFYKK